MNNKELRKYNHLRYKIFKNCVLGFTLVELLVVMAIIGILATLILGGFRSSQRRSRDAARKSDLKQIANALELFYSDYKFYPNSVNGRIEACQYDPPSSSSNCDWGTGKMEDNKGTLYFRELPKDTISSQSYYYRVPELPIGTQGFQLYARLENVEDKNCIKGDSGVSNCIEPKLPSANPPSCGGSLKCNFAVTSANVTPADN